MIFSLTINAMRIEVPSYIIHLLNKDRMMFPKDTAYISSLPLSLSLSLSLFHSLSLCKLNEFCSIHVAYIYLSAGLNLSGKGKHANEIAFLCTKINYTCCFLTWIRDQIRNVAVRSLEYY